MVFATGDCHGGFQRFNARYFPEQEAMDRNDHVIICGDFGGVWDGGSNDQQSLDWLEDKPFTTLFVSGNHENFDLLARYPVEEWHGGKVHYIRPHMIHLMRGQLYNIEGHTFFTMGGASSHDIEDGILDPSAPDFGGTPQSLRSQGRRRFRVLGRAVVMLGSNDLLQDPKLSAEGCALRMEHFMRALLSRCPDCKFLLLSPPPMTLGAWIRDESIVRTSQHLAAYYRAAAQRLNISFVDAGAWNIALAFDGVHFSESGHSAFAKGISQVLEHIATDQSREG